jgi:predicted DNA-binding transcriptional regulator AlpA
VTYESNEWPRVSNMSRRPASSLAWRESACESKKRQAAKIRDIGAALVAAGFVTLDQQAKTLGLSRSTTWTILKANHKGSGLSARVVSTMLGAPQLPARVRAKVIEYIDEKAAGRYGHVKSIRNKFIRRLPGRVKRVVSKELSQLQTNVAREKSTAA